MPQPGCSKSTTNASNQLPGTSKSAAGSKKSSGIFPGTSKSANVGQISIEPQPGTSKSTKDGGSMAAAIELSSIKSTAKTSKQSHL